MTDTLFLVTGGTGFIATHIVQQALARGIKTRTTVRKNTPEKTHVLRSLPGADTLLEIVELDLVQSPASAFEAAVQGCTHVAHTASPFPIENVEDEQLLIKPAVEGTLGVLRAVASSAGSKVKRVVVTSSCAAVAGGHSLQEQDSREFSDKDWTIVEKVSAYSKSKTLAERAAWEFHKNLGDSVTWSLCTVNPCLVLGPALSKEAGSSVDTILRFMNGRLPVVPHMSIGIVDVRDVALAHLAVSFDADQAKIAGRRFIMFSANRWMTDMAVTLRNEFQPMGYKISTTKLPKPVAWILQWFVPLLKRIYPMLDHTTRYDTTPAREILGMQFRNVDASIIDCAHASVHHGLVERKPGYVEGWPSKPAGV